MTTAALGRSSLPTLDEISDAQKLVYSVMPPTPQFVWPLLCERLAAEVWVKHENYTPIGAFKARTAVAYVSRVFHEPPNLAGLVTAARLNHVQAAARLATRKK